MKIIEGDLIKLALEGTFDVIIHGCNCQNTMGKGIAASIKANFPQAYQADLKTKKGEPTKLGKYTSATIQLANKELVVVNAYTQFHYFDLYRKVLADYDAIRNVFALIKQNYSGKHIAYPMIGAGLAGGDWNVISQIIDNELDGEQHTLVKYKP